MPGLIERFAGGLVTRRIGIKRSVEASRSRSPAYPAMPGDGLGHGMVRRAQSLGDCRVAKAELVKVEGLGGDPLVGWRRRGVEKGHLEGDLGRGSNSLRPRPLCNEFEPPAEHPGPLGGSIRATASRAVRPPSIAAATLVQGGQFRDRPCGHV